MTRALACMLGLVVSVGALGACDGRPRSGSSSSKSQPQTGPALAVLDLSGGVPEKEEGGLLGPPPGRRRAFDSLVKIIDETQNDKDTKGFFVKLGSARFGMARAQEIGDALAKVRAKMPVYCHANGLGNASLFLAARACTKITLAPSGEVEAVGIAAQVVYMHKLLAEELHIDIDILQVGKFKGAEEPLTRDGPSPEARESLEGVLADLRDSWLAAIDEGRAGHAGARDAAEDGPFAAPAAKDRGLVDEIGYEDDAREAAKKAVSAVRDVTKFGSGSNQAGTELDDVLKAFSGDDSGTPQVMVIRAVGSISMGGGTSFFGDEGITERSLVKQIKRVTEDDAVKAVVLRIDSPGGSALASDLIWHALMKLREKKPIVVSVGDMAASGGYYLASTGNEIFAEPESIVGSIGVVGGKIGLGDALEHVGVHVETFPAKKGDESARARAAYESPFVAWDDATRVRVLASMKGIYDLFLTRVAEGRKTTVDKIAVSAEGRIFSGIEGKKRGLVDVLGGLGAAMARAKELGGLPPDGLVRTFTATPKLIDVLYGGEGPESTAPIDPSKLAAPNATSAAIAWTREVSPETFVFVQSLEPLTSHERFACAVPFALVVR
ncbi:MAG TPA: S49 family peptidase [Polyangiaceae bacterium]|nr:S49 family peptidase [Polyangiaceae bacterium]